MNRRLLIPLGIEPDTTHTELQLQKSHASRVLLLVSYLVHRDIVYKRRHVDDHDFLPKPSYFHQLHSNLLKIIFGKKHYKHFVQLLERVGWIEVDHSYVNAKNSFAGHRGRSKSYRLGEKLFRVSEGAEKYKVYECDDRKAINALNTLVSLTRRRKVEGIVLSERVKGLLLGSLDQIDSGTLPVGAQWSFATGPSQCKFGRRFHSAITNLKKVRRSDLRIKGYSGHLVEIDIQNSQVFMLGQICNIDLIRSAIGEQNLALEMIIGELSASNGFRSLLADLANGVDVYEALPSGLGISREQAKEEVFKLLFGYPYSNLNSPFDQKYPGVLSCLDRIKSLPIATNSSKKMHSNVACLLQRIESFFALEQVLSRAIRDYSIDFVLTIHDSWIVKEQDVCKIQQVIRQVAIELFGMIPTLKVKDLQKRPFRKKRP